MPPPSDRVPAVWPFTWCVVHFAGAVEGMAGCLIWRERSMPGDPDCVLVQRLLVDREAIDYKAAALALHNASADQDDTFDAAHSVVDAALSGVVG